MTGGDDADILHMLSVTVVTGACRLFCYTGLTLRITVCLSRGSHFSD